MGTIFLKNIRNGKDLTDILIDGGIIKRISCAGEYDIPSGAEIRVEDCTGKSVIPGFVNMHTHAAMSLMRGLGEDSVFHDWLKKIWEMEAEVDEDYVYWGTKVACVEMLKTGTTLFNDHYWHTSAARKAVQETGIRAVLSYVMLDRFDRAEAEKQKKACEEAYMEVCGSETGFAVGIHSIYSVSEETMKWAAEFARRQGLKLHIHLSETEREVRDCIAAHGVSPVLYADSLGLLGPDTVAAHTLWLSDEDVRVLGDRGVSCVHNINSNLKLASGYRFLYNELRDAGANICIGTDGCASSNNLDILEALKTSAMVQKAWREDPTAMPIDELMSAATENGARALGLNTGKIEEGKDADLLIVDTENTFFLSPGPFLANLIYSAHSDCIDSVICKGRFVMRDRIVPGEKEIISGARKVLSKIL